MPDDQYKAIELWANKYSFQDIADLMDKSVDQVRGLIQRAKKAIKKRLM